MESQRRVLITGGAGFIGSHLADSFLRDGQSVFVLDDLSTGTLRNIHHLLDHPHFKLEVGSVMDEALCDRVVKDCNEVIHLAAAVGVKMIFERPMATILCNVHGTENILHSALQCGRKVFIASTSEVYGKQHPENSQGFREEDDVTLGTSMRWAYACSKALDEYLGRSYWISKGLPVVIGRLFNTVGPRQSGDYGMVIPRFVQWALQNKPIQVYGDGQQVRSFTHVYDAVQAIRCLMAAPGVEGQIVNIGGPGTISMLALAQKVKNMTRSSSEIVSMPYEQAFGEGFDDIRNRRPDISKLQQLTSFKPKYSLDEILEDTIRSFQR